MKCRNHLDEPGELRDIFAAVAMQGLIDGEVTPKWVATQAYKYADAMLEARNEVSYNTNNKETPINE